MSKEIEDQVNLIAERDKLKAETARLTALVAELQPKADALLLVTAEKDTLAKERDNLKTSVAKLEAERDTLRASQSDFDAKVAAKVASLGINAQAQPQQQSSTEGKKKLTFTEECLAANGKL